MKTMWLKFLRNEDGATATEYGLLGAIIAAALMATWDDFYNAYMTAMTNIGTTISTKASK